MNNAFENESMFTLMSCMVSLAGLLMLQDQCSMTGIALAMIGLLGIATGIRGVALTVGPRLAAKRDAFAGMLKFV